VNHAVDEICQQAGEHFDPRVVEAFASLSHGMLVSEARKEAVA
jgi:response regulator RpfG family c-di-GMP phosphodiesterase